MNNAIKVNWKEEDNDYLNKIFNIINLVLAFMVIFAPLIVSFVCLLGVNMDFLNVLLLVYLFFIIVKIISFSINWRFFRFRKLDVLEILAIALFVMLCITEIINRPLIFNIVFTMGYFIIFLIFKKVDKKYYKALLYSFVLTITVCSIMGVCDLNNSYMPGFLEYTYPMSLQFINPNYSGYITTMAILLCLYILCNYKTKKEQIIFWICYIVLNVCLFINGCFSAETAMFVGELFLLIYLWIKNKKCPLIVLICMFISIASSFVWIKGYSTSNANYMFEALAVIDNKLGTNLLKYISQFFDNLFGTGVIESVAGADGWARGDTTLLAIQEITASPKSFLFGYGIVYNNNVLVHNVVLQIWLEYGLINLLLYISIIVILLIRLIKTKLTTYNIFILAVMIVVIGVCHYFGCLDVYSFSYYVCLLSILAREINEKWRTRKDKSVEIVNNSKEVAEK